MKKLISLSLFLFLMAGCSNNITPQEKISSLSLEGKEYLKSYGDSISLEEAIKISKERNLDIRIKKLEREIATLDKNIAFGNFLPSINLVGNYTKLDESINLNMDVSSLTKPLGAALHLPLPSTMNAKFIDESFYTTGINAQIPIFVPSIWYLYSARQKGENISKEIEELTNRMVELETMGRYFYVLSLKSQDSYLKNQVKMANEINKKAKISLKAEAILPWELEKSKVLLKSKELSLKENTNNLRLAKMNLMSTLNLNPIDDVKLESFKFKKSSYPSLEEAIYTSLSQNNILKINEMSEKVSRDIKKIAISNFLPKIVVSGGYIKNSNEILADPEFLNLNVAGVLSIFNGFKNVNEYRKAKRNLNISQLKLEKEFMKVITETVNAYNNLEKANDFLEIAILNYNSERGRIRQKKAEFSVGSIDESEYFEALSSFDNSFSLKLKSEFQYQMAYSSLNIIMGKNPTERSK